MTVLAIEDGAVDDGYISLEDGPHDGEDEDEFGECEGEEEGLLVSDQCVEGPNADLGEDSQVPPAEPPSEPREDPAGSSGDGVAGDTKQTGVVQASFDEIVPDEKFHRSLQFPCTPKKLFHEEPSPDVASAARRQDLMRQIRSAFAHVSLCSCGRLRNNLVSATF